MVENKGNEATGRILLQLAGLALVASLVVGACRSVGPKSPYRSDTLQPGDVAPEIAAEDWLDHPPLDRDELDGKVVMIDAFGTWCPPCHAQMPGLVELYKKLPPEDVAFISLTAEDTSQRMYIREFVADYDIPWRVGLGAAETLRRFGVQGYPTIFVIGRDGKITYVSAGPTGTHHELQRAIESALMGEIQ